MTEILYKPTIRPVLSHCNLNKWLIQVSVHQIAHKGAVL